MSTLSRQPRPMPDASPAAQLQAARDRFIDLWGQMASSWGVPRSMAEVHALLFIEGRPMNMDDLMTRLGISRGNASMTARTLVDWGIVKREHNRLDRKDYFAAEQDVWTLFATVIRARKRREIDPLLTLLGECRQLTARVQQAEGATPETSAAIAEFNTKLDAMLGFVQVFDALSERFLGAESGGLSEVIATLERAP